MIRCATSDVDETRAVASKIAASSGNGDLLALFGGLGAGKTAFTQGFAAAIGIDEGVTSPTFALANRYQGRLVLNHIDAYRIGGAGESRDLGIDELLDDGVTLIEWADVILDALPPDRLDVRMGFGDGDDDRVIDLLAHGESWASRTDALAEALEAWTTQLKGSSC